MHMEPRQTLTAGEINLSDREFWGLPLDEREGAFKTLREERPLPLFGEPEFEMETAIELPSGPGYYIALLGGMPPKG